MKRKHYLAILSSLLVLLLLAPGEGPAKARATGAQASPPPEDVLAQAWQRARESGSYRFLSSIEQTLVPRPVPQMIGQGDTRFTLESDGAAALPDRAYMELRLAGGGREESLALLRDGAQAFMVQDGELKPVQDPLSLAAPTNDVLGYLAAAEKVTQLAPPEGRPAIDRYSFELSGARFAEYARQQAEAQLAAEPGAPEGIELKPSPALQQLSGHGELWINQAGLPVRQVLDIELPEINEEYGARLHMVVDLSGYGQVGELPRAVQGPGGAWQLQGSLAAFQPERDEAASGPAAAISLAPAEARAHLFPLQVPPSLAVIFVLALLAAIFLRYYRGHRRRAYALMAGTLILVMVGGPLLQAAQVVRFVERQARAAEAQAAAAPELMKALGLAAAEETVTPTATATATETPTETATVTATATPTATITETPTETQTPTATGSPSPSPSPTITETPTETATATPTTTVTATPTATTTATATATATPSPTASPTPSPTATVTATVDVALLAGRPQSVASLQVAGESAAILRCGEGSPGKDSDNDGLNDLVESCLGTDPYNPDSDGDGIPDKVEVDGFDLGGTHWTSDPLSADSNRDGTPDTLEWASAQTANGQAASPDLDGDGTPNLWDDDDDGDGVPDALDLSPFALTGYASQVSLSTDGAGFGGTQTIEIEVQPEKPEHLRYSTTALDWPADDQGNVQDLDGSTADLRLTPFLFVTTNVQPDADLAAKYGFSSKADGDHYLLLVPLQPVEDGGAVYAFYGKVAYAPGQTADVQWQEARLVWMAQMQADRYQANHVQTGTSVLHEYQDTFRVTGLQIGKSEGYEAAVLGTPAMADDRYLFQLFLGLSDTFVEYEALEGQDTSETTLDEIYERFAGSTATSTQRFDIPDDVVAMTGPADYASLDAGIAGLGSDLVPGFLHTYEGYYGSSRCRDAGGHPVDCATVLLATDSHEGVYDLGSFARTDARTADLSELHVSLDKVPVLTSRAVSLRMYERDPYTLAWQVVTPARMLELVEARYHDDYASTLSDLYPNLGAEEARLIAYTGYLWAYAGRIGAVAVDGQALVPPVPDEVQLDIARSISLDAPVEDSIDYLALVSGLAGAISGLLSGGEELHGMRELKAEWGKLSRLGKWGQGGLAGFGLAANAASAVMGGIYTACAADSDLAVCGNEDALQVASSAVAGLGAALEAVNLGLMLSKGLKALEALSRCAKVLGVVGVLLGSAPCWATFGIAMHSGDYSPATRVALAMAIVTTIWLVVLFVISLFVPVGTLIAGILSVIDFLVSLFTGLFGGEEWSIAKALLNIFYDARVLTKLDTVEFGEFESSLASGSMGLVGGNTFEVGVGASGVIAKTGDGDNDDLRTSYVQGNLTDSGEGFTAQDKSTPRDCRIKEDGKLHCSSALALGYALTPAINGVAGFTANFSYQTRWAEYGLFGAFRWKTHSSYDTLPDPDAEDYEPPQPSTIYLDVLPASLDGLWSWPALTNPDRDGDGLTDAQEAALGTKPEVWDSDGDNLSDYYEWQTSGSLGANPLLRDTDGDGLNDGLERRLGTRADVADFDGDGLLDGEEVRRLEAGALVGGWQVNAAAGAGWVSSDPLVKDGDGDGLSDAEEKRNGFSPHAANDLVPALALSAEPLRGVPGGRTGVYLKPGDPVTMTLRLANVIDAPVTTTLSLSLPGWLTDIEGGVMQGDRTLPNEGTGNTLDWSFAEGNALQFLEVVSTTVTARANPGVTPASGEIIAGLPYGDVALQKAQLAVVDGDSPAVAVLAPADGALLRGTSYVVGGAASDATTWVTGVSLSIVPEGSEPSFQRLEGAPSPWAYTWSLPGDGRYTLQARATDGVGHSTTSAVNVTVDNTAPSTTLASGMVEGTVHLSGTATDNLSGVERVQLAIDGQPWRSVALTGAGTTSAGWSYDWQVGESAQGEHEVRLRAADRTGNQSDVDTHTIVVDRVAPASAVTGGADPTVPPAVKAGSTVTLTGVADEGGNLPLPAVPADLRTGMGALADATVWLGLSTVHENDGGVLATWVGDFNADRLADLAVGLPGPDGDAGRVAVLYGRAGGWPAPPGLEMLGSSLTRFAGTGGARLGSVLAAAGDANGDNLSDLLIGERASTRAFLVFGNPGPLGEVTLANGKSGYRSLLVAPATIEGLAAAGDVDGDGLGDLLVTAGGTAYLLLGRASPWPETVDVAAEAVAGLGGVTGALGVGDADGDDLAEWVTTANGQVTLYRWNSATSSAAAAASFSTADAAPRVAALGDVDGDGTADWLYSGGTSPTLVYGQGAATHAFSGYGGFFAAPGDVDGDGRADILLSTAAGEASLIRQQPGESLEVFATVEGVAGAANAPYSAGADANSDGSSDLLLIPSQSAAEQGGFDAPDFSSGFVSPQALPQGGPLGAQQAAPKARMSAFSLFAPAVTLWASADTRYVDDDGACGGNTPCYPTIQAAVDASDGGGDTITVYPGVYTPFRVPAGTSYDNLTVEGVSADAVFVEGDAATDAIHVAADGVRLTNLTVRNAASGVVLEDGAGEPGGGETSIDHLVTHSVQQSIVMSQTAALAVSDSTLVGDGSQPILSVDATEGAPANAWHDDHAVPLPAMQPITTGGALLSTADALYATPGGGSRTVYAGTPGADGSLESWTAAFGLPYGAATSLLATSGTALYQMQSRIHWPQLGGISDGAIRAVAVAPNGDVYAGGHFSQIGGVPAQNIARWDGTSWHPLGGGVWGDYAYVFAIAVGAGNDVYAGGSFYGADSCGPGCGLNVDNVARWDGTRWCTLGAGDANGADGSVDALAWDGQDLFVGGSFSHVYQDATTAVTATGIARWNESTGTWSAVAGGVGGVDSPYVSALVLEGGGPRNGGSLLAAGNFWSAGGIAANHIARFSGSGWEPLGGGLDVISENGVVTAVAADPTTGAVYAGAFAGGGWGYGAAYRWDGASWAVLSSGPGVHVLALAADHNGNIYAAYESDTGGCTLYVQRKGDTQFQELGTDPSYVDALAPDGAGGLVSASNGISRWVVEGLYRRSLGGGTWTRLAWPTGIDVWSVPDALAGDGAGNLYAIQGSNLFYHDSATGVWQTLASIPAPAPAIRTAAWADGRLYALRADALYRYDPAPADTWTELAPPPRTLGDGASIVWDGVDALYVLRGGGTRQLMRYGLSADTWTELEPAASFTVSHGPALARVGTSLYVYGTPDGGATTNLFRYDADYTWHDDHAVPLPAMQPISTGGALLSTADTLYAVRGGESPTVYAGTPGADGSLGGWTRAFDLPYDTGASRLATSGPYLYQMQRRIEWPQLGGAVYRSDMGWEGKIWAVAIAPNGDVYVGGDFTHIGEVPAPSIARWDGTSWRALGGGLLNRYGELGEVYAIAIGAGNDVYIGGDFARVDNGGTGGAIDVGGVARWDGMSWHPLGEAGLGANGTNGSVGALAWDGQDLFVGGQFSQVYRNATTPVPAGNIASWSESTGTWSDMAGGAPYGSQPMVGPLVLEGGGPYNGGSLLVGGTFWQAGGVAANNIARYTGSGWQALGSGVSTNPSGIAVDPTTGAVYAALQYAGVRRWDGSSWTAVSGIPSGYVSALAADRGGNIYAAATDWSTWSRFYVQPSGGTQFQQVGFQELQIDQGHPYELALDGAGCLVSAGGSVYRWVLEGLYRRSPSSAWTRLAWPGGFDSRSVPDVLAGDTASNLYAIKGSSLSYYDGATGAWQARAGIGMAGFTPPMRTAAWANGRLYALSANALYRYDPAADAWAELAPPPFTLGDGASMAWNGAGDLYVLRGGGTRQFVRYGLSADAWTGLEPAPSFTVSHGPALARVGSNLYVYGTPDAGVTTNLFRYDMAGTPELRLTVERTAFVAPATAASPAWTSLPSASGTSRFAADIGADNAWVGPSSAAWSPALPAGASTLTPEEAGFVAPEDGLYRLGAGSALTAGYHHYKAEAHVYPSQGACTRCETGDLVWGETAFGTIREAVESGAARVLVHPGRYPQPFYLVSGVEVIGAGAESTIVEAPASGSGTLVTAEGVAHASLARLTLAGAPGWQGFLAEGGARGLTVQRCIIRDLSTGLHLRGGSEVWAIHDTVVRNGDGLVAEGTTPVKVRNTILAYNTGSGLTHGASPAELSNDYNDYYANGTDMDPVDVGGGKVYFDPRFRGLAANDLRLAEGSRLIDAGALNDPVPPGAGGRPDIGYAEYNAAGFYASAGYSETGENDGLTWGVDAFSTIQGALDAAAETLRGLQGAVPEGGYTVGVAAGTYTERVAVPSHVRLVGSGADVTTLDAGGTGNAVAFDGVVKAEVSGLTVQGAGASGAAVDVRNASNRITIARNVTRANAGPAVRFQGRASGTVSFNTIVDNGGAGVLAGGTATWVDVRNNIVAGNTGYGLQATVGGQIHEDYDLLYDNTAGSLDGVAAGEHDVSGDPAFAASGHYALTPGSPAIDAADPLQPVPAGGGVRADLGYRELLACPLTLLFGPEIKSTVTANSGVKTVEVGVVPVVDATQPVTATLPTSWQAVTPAPAGQPLFFWQHAVTPSAGLYRVYSRATDVEGNSEQSETAWYEGDLVGDATAPTVSWVTAPSSTEAATVWLSAEVTGAVSTGSGTRFDVTEAHFAVAGPNGTLTYPGDWQTTTGTTRRFGAWAPLPQTGSYTLTAVATDEAGNEGKSAGQPLSAGGTGHVATVTSPASGAVAAPGVTLRGYVRFAGAGEGEVAVSVGGSTVQATVAAPSEPFSTWTADISLPAGDGVKTITITPSRGGTAGTPAELALTLDTAKPGLSVSSPAPSSYVTQTVTFQGTAVDAGSGLVGVEVSVDGGYGWRPATLSSGSWSLAWSLAGWQDFTSHPARVRALDAAGNATVVACPVTVDSEPPTGLAVSSLSAAEGQHVEVGTPLDIIWTEPVDNSGTANVLVAVDQSAETEPSAPAGASAPVASTRAMQTGTSTRVTLGAVGDWYVHLAAEDAAGNRITRHYGPWHVRDTSLSTAFSERRQSIIVDGYLDVEHDEWSTATEELDSDVRTGEPQRLLAAWDGQAAYLGWMGAWWTLDGTMWAYLDAKGGGSETGVDGTALPFAADYAVEVSGPEDGTLWVYGDRWDPQPLDFANGPSGDTEARIPWTVSGAEDVRLVAFALPRADAPSGGTWAVFPTTNSLAGALTESYGWQGIGGVSDPNAGQPQTWGVALSATSSQASGTAWGPGQELEYQIDVQNLEEETLSGLEIELSASPGLSYESWSGATCSGCAAGSTALTLQVPALAAGASRAVTVTGRLASDLSGLSDVTSTVELAAGVTLADAPARTLLSHRVDSAAPAAAIDAAPGLAIAPGAQTVTGSADDGDGSGVARVEISVDGGASWQVATGTLAWSAGVNVPAGGTFTVQARAVDNAGYTGAVASRTFNVDAVAPEISFAVPAVITQTLVVLDGTAADPVPSGGQVAEVAVQVDDEGAAWQPAAGPYEPVGGVQGWAFTWLTQGDGVTRTLRARATDAVGNAAVSGWQSTTIDTVAPAITVTGQISVVVVSDYVVAPGDPAAAMGAAGDLAAAMAEPGSGVATLTMEALAATPVLVGTVSDGAGVSQMRVRVRTPLDDMLTQPVDVAGEDWSYVLQLESALVGQYDLRLEAEDVHGNVRVRGPFHLLVRNQAVAGLAATSDSPTDLTCATTLTATISAGTNVTYTWTLGDGAIAYGQVVTHTYTALGDYTAWVTGSNDINSLTTSTVVSVVKPTGRLAVEPLSSVVTLGERQLFRLTFTNTTSVPLNNVRLVTTVPEQTEVIDKKSSPGLVLGPEAGQVMWELGQVAGGQEVTRELVLRFVPKIEDGTTIEVPFAAYADESDPLQALASVLVIKKLEVPALEITKSDGLDKCAAGQVLEYAITVGTVNGVTAYNVLVTDNLPAGVSLVSLPEGAVQNADGSVTWQLGTIPAGERRTLVLQALTATDLRGKIKNEAVVTCEGGGRATASDTTVVGPPASDTTVVELAVDATPTPTPDQYTHADQHA